MNLKKYEQNRQLEAVSRKYSLLPPALKKEEGKTNCYKSNVPQQVSQYDKTSLHLTNV